MATDHKITIKKSDIGVQVILRDGNLNPNEALSLVKTVAFMIGEFTGRRMTRADSKTLDEIFDKLVP